MKNIYLLLTVLMLVNTHKNFAQTNTYPGTWQYDNGNERFIVKLWLEDGAYLGHYKKIRINNGSLIYNSRKSNNDGTYYLPFSIYTKDTYEGGFTTVNYGLSGNIDDYTIPGYAEDPRRGYIQIKLKPYNANCIDCTIQAEWKVTPTGGGHFGTPPPFSVPLDIVLTKVSDNVTLD